MRALDVANNALGDDKDNLGLLIKSMRIFSEMKGVELAAKLGISRQELSQIEKNKIPVSPKRAKEIADAMGVRFDSFVNYATKAYLKRQGIEVEELKIKFKRPLVEQMAAS
jgi:transcriptional regulator with XRE-family HTH domain